jgi:hypothetical protein
VKTEGSMVLPGAVRLVLARRWAPWRRLSWKLFVAWK